MIGNSGFRGWIPTCHNETVAYYVEIIAAITKCVVPGFRFAAAVGMTKTDCAIGAVVIEEPSHGTPLRGSKDDQ